MQLLVLEEVIYAAKKGCVQEVEARGLYLDPYLATGTQDFRSQKQTLSIRNFHQQASTDTGSVSEVQTPIFLHSEVMLCS